mmetsp:Transcript_21592/g.63360  ORF Transcript_21592/g.63360 Transcript_21592/m.63360 type:complete len:1047 (-) Transcript_21592:2344-5484(-)
MNQSKDEAKRNAARSEERKMNTTAPSAPDGSRRRSSCAAAPEIARIIKRKRLIPLIGKSNESGVSTGNSTAAANGRDISTHNCSREKRRRASCSQVPEGNVTNHSKKRVSLISRLADEGARPGRLVRNLSRRSSVGSNSTGESRWTRTMRRLSDWSSSVSGSRAHTHDGRTPISSYWSRIATVKGEEKQKLSCWEATQISASLQWRVWIRTCQTAAAHSKIIFITVLTFSIICAVGLTIVFVFASNYEKSLRIDAIKTTKVMEQRIPAELNKALLPLFTMEEIVRQVDTFSDLSFKTKKAPLYTTGTGRVFRNVTGICDDTSYTLPYDEIASSVKASAEMPRVLVNVQLAPFGVVCLLHPLINSEDFEDGIVMNNTGARGLELLNDPVNGYYARESIKNDRVTIQGPIRLVQGNVPVVKEALIARTPVYLDGHNLKIDGKNYSFWGFTTVLLNWAQLKSQVGLDEYFQSRGFEYRMTRTDILLNFTTNEEYTRTANIGKSEGSHILNSDNTVTVPLQVTDNEWNLTVGCNCFVAPWKAGAATGVVLGSLFVSLAVMTVLVAKKEHELLLYRMMPREVVHRLHRGETVVEKYDLATVCFFDIVSFTAISGTMDPVDVMAMLKDLFSEFDKLATKYQVCNVETIGDAYIVIGGGPEKCLGREGAEKVALFAYEAIEAVRNLRFQNGSSVSIRAGLASGMVIAGVVGSTQPKYTLFGDTVTLASKMESTSESMRVQCSDMTHRLLRDSQNYIFSSEQRIGYNVFPHPTYWITAATKRRNKRDGNHDLVSASAATINVSNFHAGVYESNEVFHDEEDSPGDIPQDARGQGGDCASDKASLTATLEENIDEKDHARELLTFLSASKRMGSWRASFHNSSSAASMKKFLSDADSQIETLQQPVSANGHSKKRFSISVNAPEDDDEEISYASSEEGRTAGRRILLEDKKSSFHSTGSKSEGKISTFSEASKASDTPFEGSVVSINEALPARSRSVLSRSSSSTQMYVPDDLDNDPTVLTDESKTSSRSFGFGTVEVASIYSKESSAFHTYWTR